MSAGSIKTEESPTSEAHCGDAAPTTESGRVSIIIACYNQAHFLHEAIESALHQSYANREIIVVDDGSTDNTSEISSRYPGLRYIYQENAGPSAARNAGVKTSRGDYLVFLDADDRLLRDALKLGVESLRQHPDCGFVWGFSRLILADGSLLGAPAQPCINGDHFLEMLRRNYIWCPASVTYRRNIFEGVGGFNESLGRGEDYDLFLRVTRDYPIFCHKQYVADYRLHGSTRSADSELMLRDMLTALEAQAAFVKGSDRHLEALKAGRSYWRDRYECLQVVDRIARVVETTLPPNAIVAVATGGRNELLKLGTRRAWHFPQADTSSPGRLFQQGAQGSVDVPWIEAGMRYEFRLFTDANPARDVAALSVIGVANPEQVMSTPTPTSPSPYLIASPNPVPAPNRFGRTKISWSTGNGAEGRIYLSQGGTFDSSIPQDSADAISRLEAVRARGAQYLVLPATAFWWLEKYRSFAEYLEARYPVIVRDNNCCVVFQMEPSDRAAEPVY